MSGEALPLVWTGSLFDPFGYADEARAYLIALDRAGHPAAARDIRFTNDRVRLPSAHQQAVERALARTPEGEFVLVHHRIPGPGQPLHAEGPDVARTMFETDSVPRALAAAPARGRRGVGAVRVQPRDVPARRDPGRPAARAPRDDRLRPVRPRADRAARGARATRGFTFLTNFDFTDRKGWDVLLDAWCDAFGRRTTTSASSSSAWGCTCPRARSADRIDAYLAGRPTAPILLDTRFLPTADMPRLYAGADAFVLASRGEGWGRPWMEAMAMGLPTIGSRWSGTTMFMDDANSWLVDGEVVDVAESAAEPTRPFYRGHRWFHPDREALAAALREVRRGGAEVDAKAAAGRPGLVERFGPEPIAERIAELTEAALERWRASPLAAGDVRLARRRRHRATRSPS